LEDKLYEKNELLQEYDYETVGREEFICARLYTGPMYRKYNAVLRGLNPKASKQLKDDFTDLCGNNKYSTTLHSVNSAVVKLGKLTKVTKVYRGLSKMALPKDFYEKSEHNVSGGVEFAFTSTTTKREVALQYADPKKQNPIVYEIQMGMVDRGADLSWLSQYPHEREVLFAPLTCLDFRGSHVKDEVMCIDIRLSINQMNDTIEKVTAKMQRSHLELIKLLLDDLQFAERRIGPCPNSVRCTSRSRR